MPSSLPAASRFIPTPSKKSARWRAVRWSTITTATSRRANRFSPATRSKMLNTMMQQVVTAGTARAAQLDYTYSIGKTGTSSNFRDAWFMGITGQYVAGVWLGNDDFTPMARVTGGSFPAQTWKAFMVRPTTPTTSRRFPASPSIRCRRPNRRASPPSPPKTRRPPPMQSRCRTRERQGHVFLDASGSREAECHAEGRSPAEAERRKTGSRRVASRLRTLRRSRASPPPPAPKVDRAPGNPPAEPQTALSTGRDDAAATPH